MKIGCDLVCIARIEGILQRQGGAFLKKFLSPTELPLAKNPASTAGLWAAKEAAAKALGVGISVECGFFDLIISKNPRGTPQLDLSSSVKSKFKISQASLSISHDSGFAMAVVLLF